MKAYIVKLTFEYLEPTVWRRIIFPAGATFNRLHQMIQRVTNFQSIFTDTNYHYMEMEVDDLLLTNNPYTHEEYGKEYRGLKLRYPTSIKVDKYLEKNREFLYRYDMGDDWRIKIELEDIVDDYYFGFPTLLAGEGDAPPEDVGGPPGFEDFLRVYHDDTDPDHDHIQSWAEGQGYRPFDIKHINRLLEYYKIKKTEWDKIDHDKYVVLSDKYRGPKSS